MMLLVEEIEDHDCEESRTLDDCPIDFVYFRRCFAIIWGLLSAPSEGKHIHPNISKNVLIVKNVLFYPKDWFIISATALATEGVSGG